MKRLAVALAAAAAVAVPATAASAAAQPGAAVKSGAVTGVVVAREHARGTLVVAGAKGLVRTLRTKSAVPVGTRISAKAVQLADSTYRAGAVRRTGRASRAHVHAVVVSAAHGQLVLSAGGSTFSVRAGRGVAAVGGSPAVQPGDVVDASVSISGSGGVEENGLQQVGQASLVQLEGTISSLSATTLVLAAEQGAITTISIPTSLTLPSTIAAGDRVEVLTQFAAGAFTLVSIQDDHAAASSNSGISVSGSGTTDTGSGSTGDGAEQSQVEAEGIVLAVSPTSLTVQGEHASAVVFVVPAGVDVSAVQVGGRVHAKGTLAADGTITLTRLEIQHQENGSSSDSEVEAEGSVTAVDATSLTVQPSSGSAVTFTVPAGFDVSAVTVGANVDAKGVANADGTITLAEVEVQGADESGSSGSGSGDQSGSTGSGDGGGSTGSGDQGGSSSSGGGASGSSGGDG